MMALPTGLETQPWAELPELPELPEERPAKRQAVDRGMGGDDMHYSYPYGPPQQLPLPAADGREAAVGAPAHAPAHPRAPLPGGVVRNSRDTYAQAAAVTRARDMDTRATLSDLSVLIRNVQVGLCTGWGHRA